jgi:hypothetical protein
MLCEAEHRNPDLKLFSGVAPLRGDTCGTSAAAARVGPPRSLQYRLRLSTRPEARVGARMAAARSLSFSRPFS